MKTYPNCRLRWRFAQVLLWRRTKEFAGKATDTALLPGDAENAFAVEGDSVAQGYQIIGREVFIVPEPSRAQGVNGWGKSIQVLEADSFAAFCKEAVVLDLYALLTALDADWLMGLSTSKMSATTLKKVCVLQSLVETQTSSDSVRSQQVEQVELRCTDTAMVWRFSTPACKALLLGENAEDFEPVELHFPRHNLWRDLNALLRTLKEMHSWFAIARIAPSEAKLLKLVYGSAKTELEWHLWDEERQSILWVQQRLARFTERLRRGRALPSELTVIMSRGYAKRSTECFMAMARRAVIEKYHKKGCWDSLRCLERDALVNAKLAAGADDLLGERKRISVHSSHCYCDDVDIFLCLHNPRRLSDWVFLTPDLRFRTHAQSFARLDFMCDCWTHYAQFGYLDDARSFGLNRIPLTDDYASPLSKNI